MFLVVFRITLCIKPELRLSKRFAARYLLGSYKWGESSWERTLGKVPARDGSSQCGGEGCRRGTNGTRVCFSVPRPFSRERREMLPSWARRVRMGMKAEGGPGRWREAALHEWENYGKTELNARGNRREEKKKNQIHAQRCKWGLRAIRCSGLYWAADADGSAFAGTNPTLTESKPEKKRGGPSDPHWARQESGERRSGLRGGRRVKGGRAAAAPPPAPRARRSFGRRRRGLRCSPGSRPLPLNAAAAGCCGSRAPRGCRARRAGSARGAQHAPRPGQVSAAPLREAGWGRRNPSGGEKFHRGIREPRAARGRRERRGCSGCGARRAERGAGGAEPGERRFSYAAGAAFGERPRGRSAGRPWRGEPGQGRAGPGEDEGNAVETESAGLRLWVCARLCWQGDAPSQAGRMHA